jgi:peptide/nickel transport system permease protein
MAERLHIDRPFRDDEEGLNPSFTRIVWRRVRRDPFAMGGFYIIALFFMISYLAPILANNKPIIMRHDDRLYFPAVMEMAPMRWIVKYPELRTLDFDQIKRDRSKALLMPPIPYSPLATSLDNRLVSPSRRHLMGADELGRDIMSRMIHGAGISLKVGFVAVGISLIIGLFLGALAGYYGGVIDICFPFLFLILAVIAFLPPSIYTIMVVIGITRWTDIARYTRGEFMRLKGREFTEAAKALGASDRKIIFKQILPNSMAPVLVTATFGIANAILIEAALSFLGFGVQPPLASWGGILSSAREQDFAWWMTTFPGLAIFVCVTSYNLFGEGLRDATDPRVAVENA